MSRKGPDGDLGMLDFVEDWISGVILYIAVKCKGSVNSVVFTTLGTENPKTSEMSKKRPKSLRKREGEERDEQWGTRALYSGIYNCQRRDY